MMPQTCSKWCIMLHMENHTMANEGSVENDNAYFRLKNKLLALTWDEMRQWSDSQSVERGQGYLRNVDSPVRIEDGSIVAEVHGGDDYYTRLWLDAGGNLHGDCSCPVGYRCKHAVALALVCAKLFKNGGEIEKADMASQKWKRALEELDYARDDGAGDFGEDGDWDESDFDEEDREYFDDGESDDGDASPVTRDKPVAKTGKASHDEVRDYIAGLSEKKLRELAEELLDGIPEIRSYLGHKMDVGRASDADLVRMARSAVRDATSGWYDYWEAKHDRCEMPDYSLVKEYFSLIAKSGDLQSLMTLGEELKRKAFSQAEQSRDESGEVSFQVSSCMDIVADAVQSSDIDPLEKVKWLREIQSGDDYGVLESMRVKPVESLRTDERGWSKVADYLLCKDAKHAVRDKSSWRGDIREIVMALEKSGRENEAVAILQGEPDNERYQYELIDLLMRLGRRKEAEKICRGNLAPAAVNDYRALRFLERLREMAEENGDCKTVAVCDLVKFVAYPCPESFGKLRDSCEKAKAWKQVRAGVLKYLETGSDPGVAKNWPLPPMPTKLPKLDAAAFPQCAVLCELAIFEARPDDALAWFGKIKDEDGEQAWYGYGYGDSLDWKVADAVSGKYPDEAIAIWRKHIDANLVSAGVFHYTAICRALGKMRPVMKKLSRLPEWQGIIDGIRAGYKRRTSLMKMLRDLESECDGLISEWDG